MKMKTLLALAISGICAAGVANAHDHMAKPAGPSIEVKVQQLDPANGNKDVGTVTIKLWFSVYTKSTRFS